MDLLRSKVRQSREAMGSSLLSHNKSTSANFVYPELDQAPTSIRLIRILPRLSITGLIQCTIISTKVERQPYTCLSYRWGPIKSTKKILINGKHFHVRENLYDFLSIVRGSTNNNIYWIDALCINQSNSKERNHQVTLMGNIYSSAHHVEVWLGTMTRDLRKAATMMFTSGRVLNDEPGYLIWKFIGSNEYWSRAWIVQEIMLAKLVLLRLHDQLFELTQLSSILKKQQSYGHSQPISRFSFTMSSIHPKGDSRAGTIRLEERAALLSLVAHFGNTNCEIPRDRVYSLLSISQEGSKRFTIDYEAPTTSVLYDVLYNADRFSLCICTIIFALRSLEVAKLKVFEEDEEIKSLTSPSEPSRSPRTDVGPVLDIDFNVAQPLLKISIGRSRQTQPQCETLKFFKAHNQIPGQSNCNLSFALAEVLCDGYRVDIPSTGPIKARFKGSGYLWYIHTGEIDLSPILIQEKGDADSLCSGSKCGSSHNRLQGVSIRAVSCTQLRIRIALWALHDILPAEFFECYRASLRFKPSETTFLCRVTYQHWDLWHDTDRDQFLEHPWLDDPIFAECN